MVIYSEEGPVGCIVCIVFIEKTQKAICWNTFFLYTGNQILYGILLYFMFYSQVSIFLIFIFILPIPVLENYRLECYLGTYIVYINYYIQFSTIIYDTTVGYAITEYRPVILKFSIFTISAQLYEIKIREEYKLYNISYYICISM